MRTKSESDETRRDYVQSFARGLEVIRAFSAQTPAMTLSEVAEKVGITRAAARRLLLTLAEEGYARTDGRDFRLTPRILDLGYAYLSGVGPWEGAQIVLTDVTREVGESCSLSVLEGDEVVYVARVTASRMMTLNLRIGSRLPAFHTSTGRVMLAYRSLAEVDNFLQGRSFEALTPYTVTDHEALRRILRETRERGWCICDQELERGLISLAVPVYDRSGGVNAALNVSAEASRMDMASLVERALPLLQRAAETISRTG
ncbi:helix-turn-helix domain-containing protein [Phenylobacterium sp. LjRoot164]|uniref:IclR family transcriptional regulator domain-containing protein n=1 Tax=unclassified Phenylobacterium TaxID=2640670 RepID=UPI003ED037A5